MKSLGHNNSGLKTGGGTGRKMWEYIDYYV